MDKIKKCIIAIIVVILLIIIVLCFYKYRNENNDDKRIEEPEDYQSYFITENRIEYIAYPNKYYLAKNIIETYIQNIKEYFNYSGAELNQQLISEEDLKEMVESTKKDMLLNIKSALNDYMEQEDISDEQLIEMIAKYKEGNVKILNIDMAKISVSIDVFCIHIYNYTIEQEEVIMLVTDSKNYTYKILESDYVKNNNYDKLQVGDVIYYQCDSISDNQLNKFKYTTISNEQLATDYFGNYKWKVLNDEEEAYNSLQEDYRNARFKSFDDYKNYIEKNRDEIQGSTLEKYLVNTYDDYTEYVCIDQYDNLYIFKATAVMQYTLKLDTYTIPTEKFKTEYDNSDEQTKVGMNIEKIITAINNEDYNYVYSKLDETFRNNNFTEFNKFEEFLQNNFYESNEVSYKEFEKLRGVYTYTMEITNANNSEETNKITIIMKLQEDTDFIISFGIN